MNTADAPAWSAPMYSGSTVSSTRASRCPAGMSFAIACNFRSRVCLAVSHVIGALAMSRPTPSASVSYR
ncbi:MAG: hypothetical protein JWP76_2630 [Dactylosporangium sp.]|nr:hypothetical protein [Dactylosporangium sp.]